MITVLVLVLGLIWSWAAHAQQLIPPIFQRATPVSTVTVVSGSTTTIDFTGLSQYDNYQLLCYNLLPTTNNVTWSLRYGQTINGANAWANSNYTSGGFQNNSGSATVSSAGGTSVAALNLAGAVSNSVSGHNTVIGYFSNFKSTTEMKPYQAFELDYNTNPGPHASVQMGMMTGNTNPVVGIQLSTSVGGWAAGTCNLYGIN